MSENSTPSPKEGEVIITVHLRLYRVGADSMHAIIHVRLPEKLIEGRPYHAVDAVAISKAKETLKNYLTDADTCVGAVASLTKRGIT